MSELKTCFKRVDYDLSSLLHFIDIGDIVTNAVVGSRFGWSLAWVVMVPHCLSTSVRQSKAVAPSVRRRTYQPSTVSAGP